jgi:glutathione S-transferase
MKLSYFNVKGISEPIRLIFAAAGVEYEDFRYPLEVVDLASYKFNRKEFDDDKNNGKLKKSMGKVPFLETEGKVICQSKAIERYLAAKFNLMGDNLEDSAIIDSYCECIRDIKTSYFSVKKTNDKDGIEKWFNETLPEKLLDFESLLVENNTKTIKNKPNLAEIKIYHFLIEFFDNKN